MSGTETPAAKALREKEERQARQERRRTALVEIIAILQSVDEDDAPGEFPARLLNAAAAYYGMTPVANPDTGNTD